MTDTRDNLLDRLAQANPVPDPRMLVDDENVTEHAAAPLGPTKINVPEKSSQSSPLRSGRGILAAGAVAIVILLTSWGFFQRPESISGDIPIIEITFDGATCLNSGPPKLEPGAVTITFHNTTTESARLDFIALSEGKTRQDLVEYLDSSDLFGLPPWYSEVAAWRAVPSGTSRTLEVYLEPGTSHPVCSTDTPYRGYLGPSLQVTS